MDRWETLLKIRESIKLLRENGYAVIKLTDGMKEDIKECDKMDCRSESKDCESCSYYACLRNMI